MVKKSDASAYLGDVSADKYFWVNNGGVLKNMYELLAGLEEMDESTYSFHANSEKNDFSKWVAEVIGDTKLSNELITAKDKKSAADKVRKRIEKLMKAVNK